MVKGGLTAKAEHMAIQNNWFMLEAIRGNGIKGD